VELRRHVTEDPRGILSELTRAMVVRRHRHHEVARVVRSCPSDVEQVLPQHLG
jgi:hypothetical protein